MPLSRQFSTTFCGRLPRSTIEENGTGSKSLGGGVDAAAVDESVEGVGDADAEDERVVGADARGEGVGGEDAMVGRVEGSEAVDEGVGEADAIDGRVEVAWRKLIGGSRMLPRAIECLSLAPSRVTGKPVVNVLSGG